MRLAAALVLIAATSAYAQAPLPNPAPPPDPEGIAQHDLNRTPPSVVKPVDGVPPAAPGKPPSDAVVLFDGKDLSTWKSQKDAPAPWKVENGYFEVVKGTGGIETKPSVRRLPAPRRVGGADAARGHEPGPRQQRRLPRWGRYEVQVLDCYQTATYPDGQAGALYGQYPPLVNATRPPGDGRPTTSSSTTPRFDTDGKLQRPARVTVLLNGVLVQNAQELIGADGPQGARRRTRRTPPKLPLALQDHDHPVRFRNVWMRELKLP